MGFKAWAAMLVLATVWQTAGAAAEVLWRYRPEGGYVDASPAAGDLDGDNHPDIVVTTTAGSVVALDGKGQKIWERVVRGPITTAPTLVPLSTASAPGVALFNNAGELFLLDGSNGTPLWDWAFPAPIEWGVPCVLAADIDQDGLVELVTGDGKGTVACLSEAGALRWTYHGEHGGLLPPTVADLDSDGMLDIICAGTEIPLFCLGSDGRERWQCAEQGRGASPVLLDINGDGSREIIGAVNTELVAASGTGEILWRFKISNKVDSAISVMGDGSEARIFAADLDGLLVCLNGQGAEQWRADVEERVRRSPSIGDIDGDGQYELLVAGYSGAVHVFDMAGHLEERFALDGNCNATASLVDFDGDGHPAVVCPNKGGTVQVIQWPSAGASAHPICVWPQYRLNAERTGIANTLADGAVQLTRFDQGALYTGENVFCVDFLNLRNKPFRVTLKVDAGKGMPFETALDVPAVAPSTSSTMTPETLALPYILDGEAAANVTFRCEITADGKKLCTRERTYYVAPFQRELHDAKTLLAEAETLMGQLKDADGIGAKRDAIARRLAALDEQAAAIGTAPDLERRAFRDDLRVNLETLRETTAIARAALAAQQNAGTALQVCAANPWAPFGGMAEVGEERLGQPAADVIAFGGETESAAFNLFNFTSTVRTFRITLESLEPGAPTPDLKRITLREALDVPSDLLITTPDAIPELNQARTLMVAPWSARQLWVSIDATGMAPGVWKGAVRFKSLDVKPAELVAPLTMHVAAQSLPAAQALTLCHWGYVHTSVLKDQPQAALADQVAHGTNVFVGVFSPKAKFDETGAIVGEIDYADVDAYVDAHKAHGFILFCGYQGGLQGPAAPDSEAFRKAHVAWLRAWVAHLAQQGVGYDKFALYPVDEPGLSDGLVAEYLRYAKLAREADPRILMYTDPVKAIKRSEIEAMLPYVDIWCPNRNGFLLRDNNDLLELIKSSGKTVWTYECEGNAKHQSPLGYYRGLAWLAWGRGLTGVGFWSYCTSPDDPWYRPKGEFDYLLIYQGNGVVPSKRWEAIRDGIEDYGLLTALRDAVAAAERDGRTADAVARAKALLDKGAWEIAQFCGLDPDGTLPAKGGAAAERVVADARWHALQECRTKMAQLFEELGKP